jgi:hypothetical protein
MSTQLLADLPCRQRQRPMTTNTIMVRSYTFTKYSHVTYLGLDVVMD